MCNVRDSKSPDDARRSLPHQNPSHPSHPSQPVATVAPVTPVTPVTLVTLVTLPAAQERLQAQAAEADEALRLVRRTEASREAYLLRLEQEAAEAAARNSTQQRRLEELTSENSKLKKESLKLRSDVTGARMEVFQKELVENELRSAKEAVATMEAQTARLQQENSALRAGGDGVEVADLSWLRTLPHGDAFDVVLYSKGGGEVDEALRHTTAMRDAALRFFKRLPNFGITGGGREAHAMWQFLIYFYHNLPEVILFSQDDCSGGRCPWQQLKAPLMRLPIPCLGRRPDRRPDRRAARRPGPRPRPP